MARAIPGVRVVDEPVKGLVVARETARARRSRRRAGVRGRRLPRASALARAGRGAAADVARCWSAVTGPYRFYDWDLSGRALIRLYDVLVAPPTHVLVHHVLGIGAILYGGNFAVRADALARIGGFDRTIEFHGEDTNLGRRLTRDRPRRDVAPSCWVWTSARRYVAMGKRRVFSLYVRNFWSEILRHRPADREHLDVRA